MSQRTRTDLVVVHAQVRLSPRPRIGVLGLQLRIGAMMLALGGEVRVGVEEEGKAELPLLGVQALEGGRGGHHILG